VLAVAPSLLLRIQADHVTGTAETRRVALTDGSIAELGPESAIATRFTAGQRRVSLISGTAFFEVAPDAGRPFVVDAAGIEATALGTAFDVRLSTRSVSVGVASGTVGIRHEGAVSPDIARLGPGERAHVDRETGAATLDRVAPDAVASWRDGRLFVADATVAEVVEELRRYHAGWIVIADDRLAAAQVNGLYDLRDPGRALRAVVQPAGGLVRRVTPLLYVLSRP
jgi:transmembrane sensor